MSLCTQVVIVAGMHSSFSSPLPVTIRQAQTDDEADLWRLAALDSAPVLRDPVLVAEADGELRAAVSSADLRAIADPFQRTAELVDLLRRVAATSG